MLKSNMSLDEGNEDDDSKTSGFVNTYDSIHVLDHANNAEEVEFDVSGDELILTTKMSGMRDWMPMSLEMTVGQI